MMLLILSLLITPPTSDKIALFEAKIKSNELSSNLNLLVYWNPGEDFPSLGIGHFIWFPKNTQPPFQESFPKLLAFLKQEGEILPSWIQEDLSCPWNTREEFLKDEEKRKSLECFLEKTSFKQAEFIVKQGINTLQKILDSCQDTKKDQLKQIINTLLQDHRALFAFLDYIHFKGTGLDPKEYIQNQGYGLLQVLEYMINKEPSLDVFIEACIHILENRVNLSQGRDDKWLKGWKNRIYRYKDR